MRMTRLAMSILLACQFCAARGADTPITGIPFRYCKAAAPIALQKSLCNGDSTDFWQVSKDLMDSSDPQARQATITVLERLWSRDKSLGDGLPWNTLYSDNFEAFVVERLAPAIRDAESDVALSDLQAFVIRYKSTPSSKDYPIALIGITDTPGQVQFLADVIRQSDGGRRRAAILALGTMCEDAATDLLRKGVRDMRLPENDLKVAKVALDIRYSDRVKAWCAHPQPHGGTHISL